MQSTVQKNYEQAKLEGYVRLLRRLHCYTNDDKRHTDVSKLEEVLEQRDINYQLPHNGLTALHLAAVEIGEWLTTSSVEFLIDRGADPTIANHERQTVVHWMLNRFTYGSRNSKSNTWINLVLTHIHVENKITTNFTDVHGLSHFHAACMTDNAQIVEFFLSNGVSVDDAVGMDSPKYPGCTPLHFAVEHGRLGLVDKLLSRGADVRARNANGMTPLHALVKRNITIVEHVSFHRVWKYEYWEEDNVPDRTKLRAEMETNWRSIAKILERTDARTMESIDLFPFYVMRTLKDTTFKWTREDINESVSFDSTFWPGYTALHFAAHFDIDSAKLLIDRGANVDAKDAHGVTPLDLCVGRYSTEDVHFIISSHALWKNILLTDGKTKLSDLVLAMRNPKDLAEFLREIHRNINSISIPRDSPLWPGFTILHLAVTLLKRAMRFRAPYCTPLFEDFVVSKYYLMDLDRGDPDRTPDEMIGACLDLGADVAAQDSNGSTPIHLALRRFDLECLYFLLQRCDDGNSNPTDEDNLSLLHVGCLVEDATLVKRLLASGADPNAAVSSSFRWDPHVGDFYDLNPQRRLQIRAGFTALHVCNTRIPQATMKEIARCLIDAGADVKQKDAEGLTPLHRQISQWHNSDLFDDDQLARLVDEDCRTRDGLSYLHVAAHCEYPKLVEKSLDVGADVNSRIVALRDDLSGDVVKEITRPASDVESCTPLHLCLQFCYEPRDHAVARVLVSRGADVLARNSKGDSPICRMLKEPYKFECLLRLYLSAMSVDEEKRLFDEMGLTRLHVASRYCDVRMMRKCLKKGANANARVLDDAAIWPGFTPLHLLMEEQYCNGKIRVAVRLLLEAGADVTIVDAKGESPLMMNIRQHYVKKSRPLHVDILWKTLKNSNVNPVSHQGISHFHLACIRGDADLVERFLKLGVDPNQTVDHADDKFPGYTPLHFAVSSHARNYRRPSDTLRTIDLLLDHGAKVDATNVNNVTPLDVAAWNWTLGALPYERILCAGADLFGDDVPYCWALDNSRWHGYGNLLGRFVRFVRVTSLREVCDRIRGLCDNTAKKKKEVLRIRKQFLRMHVIRIRTLKLFLK